ncbi:hypothetical protein MMC07_008790 [Pseudocyphellaria aurata]|nr:hypothetical protein [Pseudocyphellaria aurata]
MPQVLTSDCGAAQLDSSSTLQSHYGHSDDVSELGLTVDAGKSEAQQPQDIPEQSEFEMENLVDWDGLEDAKNPMNWTPARKWATIALVSAITFITAMASTLFAPGVPLLMQEFRSDNEELASFTVSVYVIGFCVGPLVLSPLSELYGRSPIMHASNVFFFIFTIACGVSSNLAMFIVFRLFMGIAGCPPLTLGGGTIADLQPPEKRGMALSIWTMGPLMGPVIGPVVGGYLAQSAGWRWIFWFSAILTGVLTVFSFFFLSETYAPTILNSKAKRLREETGNPNLKSKYDKGQTPKQLFTAAIVRPTKMLLRSPIVFLLAIYMAMVYSYLYFLFTTFTSVFEDQYGFSTGEAGLAYLGLGVGFLIGQLGVGVTSDRYLKIKAISAGGMKPEHRLPPLVIGAFLVPIGLLWYGWSAQYRVHWIVPIVGTAFIGVGTLFAFLPIQMYLVDAFEIYAASAIATNTVVRSLFGATLPLAGSPLYTTLGLGWGNTLLALIALALSPMPILLIKYGERIRTDPRFQPNL